MKSLATLLSEATPEAKHAKDMVKRLDVMADEITKLEKAYNKNVSGKDGKALYNLGVDDSRNRSDSKVKELHGAIEDAFEDMQIKLTDLANAIDSYHL